MRPLTRAATLFLTAILLAGCATLSEPRCASNEQRLVSDLLYFGTAKPGGIVSSEEWSEFLRGTVTPKFPEGLSAWQASGQWRSAATGAIVSEASHVLNLVHPETPAAEAAVQAVVADYKSRFQQEAVLRVKNTACVSF
ncbi:Protein of unknown function [Polaromonas sp. YR568]|uniref:DUF3574 domain-containing protein n=1 Tax=Polaromonas sp. YR568 TaxID=1855301 RepID=UPI0008E5D4BE|nr:DUF3574 domain-containing protein [Polaromonas sp. YR568]SFU40555.1 Protein of unknown function [Polaromonas sp. YR568]